MKRYAIYYLPPPGPLATFGAEWLGWDPVRGVRVAQPMSTDALVAQPRKYGLHATLKAPFRLDGTQQDLEAAVSELARSLSPVWPGELAVSQIGRFLALVPQGDQAGLNDLAAQVVETLDPFRAPLTDGEIARRHPERLSERQRALLDRWGYPFVMEEFRFHITLTGPTDMTADAMVPMVAPVLPAKFGIHEICLVGEGDDGMFRLIRRYPI
ncbi:DUF1045 domain-containing protein [Falsirhodobacter sp. alg1]|uniref:DUF1045 domain-containing protein n=1 Tax=Falsirhodobacter sp. alg1 TaxID=1472418 RepID=UPI0005F0611C|nr:DUF1045 domain-containing protein [Falsirhodobacter sp. alg1]